jgi:hypothetical protein
MKTHSQPEMAKPSRLSERRIAGFVRALGISRTKYNTLTGEMKPRTVNLGPIVLVTETPAEYLARIEAMQRGETQAAA